MTRVLQCILFTTVSLAAALECYSGFKYIRGQSVGSDKITCKSSSEYCYNVTADLTNLNVVSKAGCSSTRCFIAHNKCVKQNLFGKEVQFCCCNDSDLCNSKKRDQSTLDKLKEKGKAAWDVLFRQRGSNKN